MKKAAQNLPNSKDEAQLDRWFGKKPNNYTHEVKKEKKKKEENMGGVALCIRVFPTNVRPNLPLSGEKN